MSAPARPGILMRAFLKVPVLLYRGPLAAALGRRVCVLTTRGRRTGAPRRSGLNYAMDGDIVYVVSGWGARSDWYRNALADPRVTVQIGARRWRAIARTVTDAAARGRALGLLRTEAPRQGPPRILRPLLARLGLDYDAEVAGFERTTADLPVVALTPA